MNRPVTNLRSGTLARSAPWITGAVVCVLGLSGVVVSPALEVDDSRVALAAMRERAATFRRRSAELEELRASGRVSELEDSAALLAELVPGPPNAVELHTIARLAARSAGVALESVDVSEAHDTGRPLLERSIHAHRVALTGDGTQSALVRLVDAFEELGRPVAVEELHLTRAGSGTSRFRLALDVHHGGPPVAAATADPASSDEDMP